MALLLHFLKFGIQTSSLEMGAWPGRLYASNDLTRRFPNKVASLTLSLQSQDAADAPALVKRDTAVFTETNLCRGRCYYDDGRFLAECDGDYPHVMDYDLRTHVIRANIGSAYRQHPQAIISNLVRPILQSFILPFYGIKTLHGALVRRGERTIFLAGRGGMGKTTAAIQLMRAGYTVLSDDAPWFVVQDGSAYALSSLDFLHLTPHTLTMFPELRRHVIGGRDHRDKVSVRLSDCQTGRDWTEPVRVTDYVRLDRRADVTTPRLTRSDRSAVHRAVLNEEMTIFRRQRSRGGQTTPFQAYSEFVFDVLTKVIQGADTYDLAFGDAHLSALPALLGEL